MAHRRPPPVHQDRCPRNDHPDPWDQHDDHQMLEDVLHALIYVIEGELVIMATIDDLNTAVAAVGADAQAAADRVLAAIAAAVADASAQIADLQAQVQTLIDGNAGDITPAQLDALATGLTAADATINAIAPTP